MIEQAFAVGVDIAIKATILVGLVFALDRVLVKQVLIRSAIWNACMVALLALPITTVMFPRVRIDYLRPQSAATSNRAPDSAPAEIGTRNVTARTMARSRSALAQPSRGARNTA